jgi:drug/metabolite transporter (DMT)-like permease
VTALLLALLSALAYGISDFVGGVVSRRTAAWGVALVVQGTSALTFLVAAPWVDARATGDDLRWGVVAGVGSGVGISFLFRGFAAGRMSVVAPLSAVGAAVLPAAAGFVLGERLGALVLVGLLVAIPGIWLVSSGEAAPAEPYADDPPRSPVDRGVLDGCLAGVGFAVAFVALDQVSTGAGLWPLFVMQAASTASVPVLALLVGAQVFPLPRTAWQAWYGGPVSAVAGLSFYLATSYGLLSVAAVLASLYPAVTILLAVLLLRERIRPGQLLGLALCGLCVGLVVSG